MQGQPEEPASILAVVGAGVQRAAGNLKWLGSDPFSIGKRI
jgi:hypothetical protein